MLVVSLERLLFFYVCNMVDIDGVFDDFLDNLQMFRPGTQYAIRHMSLCHQL